MNLRKQLIIWLFENSQRIYAKLFKHHEPWKTTKSQLLQLPEHTFGKHLGSFLDQNNFELIPKIERHDAYHTLTGYSTKVEDEIALQYLCLGNGKRSVYMFGAVILGTILLPEYISYYLKSYSIGKASNAFHHFNFEKLIHTDFNDLRSAIFTSRQLHLCSNINT